MPQADVGIINSSIFFLFLSFLGGYFIWVNFIFPRLIAISKVRSFILEVKPQPDEKKSISLKRLEVKLSFIHFLCPFLVVSPFNSLNLYPDEIILLFNTCLISLVIYLVGNFSLGNEFKILILSTILPSQKHLSFGIYNVVFYWLKNRLTFLSDLSSIISLQSDQLLDKVSFSNIDDALFNKTEKYKAIKLIVRFIFLTRKK